MSAASTGFDDAAVSPHEAGQVVYLAPEEACGTRELAAFLAHSTGGCLAQFRGEEVEAFAGAPLGPGTRLVVVSIGALGLEQVRRVICISPCPVLAVPRRAENIWAARVSEPAAPAQPILCGSDGGEPARVARDYATHLAAACATDLLVSHVRPDVEGPVAERLSRIARDEQALLVAVGSDCNDPGGLSTAESVTGALLVASSAPILIVPPWTKIPRPAPGQTSERRAPQLGFSGRRLLASER